MRQVGDVCFEHDGNHPSQNMTGALCFDIKQAPITENPLFCPFVLDENKEFAWIDEFLQQQENGDPKRPGKLNLVSANVCSESNLSSKEEEAASFLQDVRGCQTELKSWPQLQEQQRVQVLHLLRGAVPGLRRRRVVLLACGL